MLRKLGLPALALAGLMVAGLTGMGCKDMMGNKEDATSKSDQSLYEQLGGKPAVTKVVDDFVALAAKDPAVNFDRKNPPHPHTWDATPENVAKLKKHLVQFISKATGGPVEYTGESMPDVHTGMQITDEEFNAAAADLQKALEMNGVPKDLENRVMDIVGTTRSQMVGK